MSTDTGDVIGRAFLGPMGVVILGLLNCIVV